MSKISNKRSTYINEILRLKRKRRIDVLKCALALTAIIVLLLGKQALAMAGFDVAGSMALGAIEMVATIALAILGGTASIDFTKSGNQINAIKHSGGISDEQIKAYADSK